MSLQDLIGGLGSSQALQDAASRLGVDPAQAGGMLQGVLEHLHGGGGLEDAAAAVAAKTGLDLSQVQEFLPQVAGLLQAHAENASEGAGGILGGLLGSLRG